MFEKRKYIRLNAYVDVAWAKTTASNPSPASQGDKSRNVSEGGLCLNIGEAVSAGDVLDLMIKLPNQKTLRSKGRVQWVKESEIVTKRYDIGLEFLDISAQDREEMKAFVLRSQPPQK